MKSLLLSMALGLASLGTMAQSYTTTSTDKLKVWVEIPTVIADGETVNYFKVFEHDDNNTAYTAFNMTMEMPAGFSTHEIKEGRDMVEDIHLSDRAHKTHSISYNFYPGTNDLKIISDSSINADLYNDDEDGNPLDELFTMGLIASSDIPSGEYTVRVYGIKFVMADGNACTPADQPLTLTMVVKNPTTSAIEEIQAENMDPAECWDIMGRHVNPATAPKGTIVIYRGHKVMVK